MRQFAEDRAGQSGWDLKCLSIDNLESRRVERTILAEKISESYKEEFVRVNKAEGKGRPKANNISAAKKTVRMIAERILLSLEAKATQSLFNEVMDKGKESEKELLQLRQIHKCGKENPKLSYEQVVVLASARLNGLSPSVLSNASMTKAMTPSAPTTSSSAAKAAIAAAAAAAVAAVAPVDGDDDGSTVISAPGAASKDEIEGMKQALVEMRAEQVARGLRIPILDMNWAHTVQVASEQLVRETYNRVFVPKTKVYGCRHFTRKNRVLMTCCGTFAVCRMCHIQDERRLHEPRIEPVRTMLCMMCGEVQSRTQSCRKCGQIFGSYYCDVCGITDDTPGYDLRHCSQCNVCMPGLTFHCSKCNSCVPATPDHDAICTGSAQVLGHGGDEAGVSEDVGPESPSVPRGTTPFSGAPLEVSSGDVNSSDSRSVTCGIFRGL